MSDAVERVEKAVMEMSVCGITVGGVRMLCCDERAKREPGYSTPEDCICRNAARAVRAITLEEAAKVAEGQQIAGYSAGYRSHDFGVSEWHLDSQYGKGRSDASAAIRKLGEE